MDTTTIYRAVASWKTNQTLAETVYGGPIGSWDTSQVESMAGLFKDYIDFNEDISGWNVSQVVSMRYMFHGATKFHQDLNSWDVRKVYAFSSMFEGAKSFNGNIADWNVSATVYLNFGTEWRAIDRSFSRMFYKASSFQQTLCWDFKSRTITDSMFCESLGGFDPNCTSANFMETSQACPPTPQPTIAPSLAPSTTFDPARAPVQPKAQPNPSDEDFGTCNVTIGQALGELSWTMYGVAIVMVIVAAGATFVLLRAVDPTMSRQELIFEAAFAFLADVDMVFLFLLSFSAHYNFEDVEYCGEKLTFWALMLPIAVYGIDLVLDVNALVWSRVYGIHADEYGQAQYEGLERLHGFACGIPMAVYLGAGVSFPVSTINLDEGEVEGSLYVVGWGFLALMILWILMMPNIYLLRFDPNFNLSMCWCSQLYLYETMCFRNAGTKPHIGPHWGFWIGSSSVFMVMMIGVSGAFFSAAVGDITLAIPGIVLAAFEFGRIVAVCCKDSGEEDN